MRSATTITHHLTWSPKEAPRVHVAGPDMIDPKELVDQAALVRLVDHRATASKTSYHETFVRPIVAKKDGRGETVWVPDEDTIWCYSNLDALAFVDPEDLATIHAELEHLRASIKVADTEA